MSGLTPDPAATLKPSLSQTKVVSIPSVAEAASKDGAATTPPAEIVLTETDHMMFKYLGKQCPVVPVSRLLWKRTSDAGLGADHSGMVCV